MMPMMISTVGKALPAGKLRKNSVLSAKKITNIYDKTYETSPKIVQKVIRTRNNL
jgi:hypothetical protein